MSNQYIPRLDDAASDHSVHCLRQLLGTSTDSYIENFRADMVRNYGDWIHMVYEDYKEYNLCDFLSCTPSLLTRGIP